MALAEPDYGGRIDYPEQLGHIGRWQAQALRKQALIQTQAAGLPPIH